MARARGTIDRRSLGLAAGAFLLSGCAADRTAMQVNMAAPTADERTALLPTGADPGLRMTAPVRINEQGPFAFVVDTGANRTVVSQELAQALALPDAGAANIHGVAGVEPARTVRIALLQADSVAERGLRAPALPRDRLGADGLLGVDVLADRRVLMNFVERSLAISPRRAVSGETSTLDMRVAETGARRDLGRRVAVPARFRFGQLVIIGADVSGRRITAFVDSGSQSTVGNAALADLMRLRLRAPGAPQRLVPVLSATGQTAQGVLGDMPLLRIGDMTINNLTTVFADLHVFELWGLTKRPSLLLGMDVLTRFNAIELDYAGRQVVFYLPPGARPR